MFLHVIGLIDDDAIGKRDLFHSFFALRQRLLNTYCIDQTNGSIQLKFRLNARITDKWKGNGVGLGHSGRFNDEVIKGLSRIQQLTQSLDEFPVERTTDAAIGQFKNVFLGANDEIAINGYFPKFIFDDGKFFLRMIGDDLIEQAGFACAEETGDDGDWNGHEIGLKSWKV